MVVMFLANTKEQQQAIDMEGTNIIVSAGAGSGKTAVLTQRVIRKITDGVDVDRLLVLTFTNEAAAEMKKRIRDAIIKNKLDKQLGLLDSAYITTFDSFALSLVKKYAYLLDAKQNIKMIDSNVMMIYKYRVMDKIFEEMYGDSKFDKLIQDFCLKDDKSLKDDIINLANKLDLQIDKEKFIETYFDKYCNQEFIDKQIIKYEKLIKTKILELQKIYEGFTSYITDSLCNKLDNYFKPLFQGDKYSDYVTFLSMNTVRFTGVSEEGLDVKELLKEKIEEIKKLLKYKDMEEIAKGISNTYDYIEVILLIIKKLDDEVIKYKKKYDIYEFNDIAHMAITLVKQFDYVREEIRDYFNEIMVDEYQDTSSIQEEFVSLISNDNVYMVGDVKQSIYRFRNANPYIFQDKYNLYSKGSGGVKIDLLKNFRSRSETLNNINEIFNVIMDDEIGNADYITSHNMVYGNTNYDIEKTGHNNSLEIYNYEYDKKDEFTREEKELFIISEDINKKIREGYLVFDKDSSKLRPLKYSDICIITDRNKYLDKYKKILEYNGIPSVIYMDLVLTNDMVIMVIKNLVSLVYFVNERIQNNKFKYVFTSVARSFIFNYTDNEIYNIFKDNKIYENEIINICKNIDLNNSLLEIINDILSKFKIYDKLTCLHNIDENIVRIDNLLDMANSLNDLGYSLGEFIDYIDEVIERGLLIKYSVNTSGEDAVKIMNIHKSKGLEFSLCYFTGMHNKFTIKDIDERILFNDELGIILPYVSDDGNVQKSILRELYVDNFFKEEVSEKIRLFYVALTRCREKMIIVTSLRDENGNKYTGLVPVEKRIKYRSFLDILDSVKAIDRYVVNVNGNYSHDYEQVKFKEIDEATEGKKIVKREIKINSNLLDNKHFSKGHIGLFDKDEIKLMEYGTKVHEMLEYALFKKGANKYVDNLLGQLDNNYIRVYREYEFKYIDDGVLYHGIIDLMLEYDQEIKIVDYKLKNIDDENYIKQISGYRDYIMKISQKDVNVYLYSIMDNKLRRVI